MLKTHLIFCHSLVPKSCTMFLESPSQPTAFFSYSNVLQVHLQGFIAFVPVDRAKIFHSAIEQTEVEDQDAQS